MRATKITKYFEYENNNPLNFFPVKQKKENKNTGVNNDNRDKGDESSIPKATSIPSSSFDTINIQLETKYYKCGSTIEYFIYFNNNSQLDIKGSITNVGDSINGDLMALHEALKYIVYHPNMSQKLNRYKFNIYTNSNNISNCFKTASQTQVTPHNGIMVKSNSSLIGTNVYLKIQSLLRCIKNISIEYWNSN
jgi:hypothetical protein